MTAAVRQQLRATSSRLLGASEPSLQRMFTRVGESRGQPVDLYHEIHGDGKNKVLFITGWAGSCDNWKFQTDFFRNHGDYQVCIYENRGSGYSSAPLRNYRMSDMAQDAHELCKHLGWKEKVHVVGVSMGGMIAQELAIIDPNRIGSLTLASTSAGRALPPMKHMAWVGSSLSQIAMGLAEVKDKMPHILYSPKWLMEPAPEGSGYQTNLEYMLKFHAGRTSSRPPQSIFAAIAQLWGIIRHHVPSHSLQELRARLLSSSIPSMVVHGTEDVLVRLRTAWDLARDLGARMVVFEGRGHALNHEDTETFNKLLVSHFDIAADGSNGRVKRRESSSDLIGARGLEDPEIQRKMKSLMEFTPKVDSEPLFRASSSSVEPGSSTCNLPVVGAPNAHALRPSQPPVVEWLPPKSSQS